MNLQDWLDDNMTGRVMSESLEQEDIWRMFSNWLFEDAQEEELKRLWLKAVQDPKSKLYDELMRRYEGVVGE